LPLRQRTGGEGGLGSGNSRKSGGDVTVIGRKEGRKSLPKHPKWVQGDGRDLPGAGE